MASLPFKVKAVYDYSSPHEDDLSFSNGQIITVTDEEDTEWYYGEYTGSDGKQQGLFPRNFVEKYEPTTPPRPSRRARKDDVENLKPASGASDVPPVPEIPPEATKAAKEPEVEPEPLRDVHDILPEVEAEDSRGHEETTQAAPLAPRPPQQLTENFKPVVQATSPEPVQSATKAPPLAVTNKPTGGSFRDRIAAFNKPAAPPVAPMKPGGLSQPSTSGFIKKQYVAPPPSRNAYVPPPPREPPAKVYRREEEVNSTAQSPPEAMPAAVPHVESSADDQAEEQPKPTSLKERIALLQKQQLEQAARHAEVAQKKEKPKRPPQKRMGSQQDVAEVAEGDPSGVVPGTKPSRAPETEDEDSPEMARVVKRRSKSKEAIPLASPGSIPQELISDTNDADQSAGADTEDGGEVSSDQRQDARAPKSSAPPPPPRQEALTEQRDNNEDEVIKSNENEGEDDGAEEEEDEDIDPEVRRRMEIRERMAKMSGGMGMAGMFGPPGGLPSTGTRKAKSSGSSAKKQATEETRTESDLTSSQPIQAMALPGMSMPGIRRVQSPKNVDDLQEGAMEEDKTLGLGIHGHESDDSDDDPDKTNVPERSMSTIPSSQRSVPAPVPGDGASTPPQDESTAPVVANARAVPPLPPNNTRPPPPPPHSVPQTVLPNSGSDSDDELSMHTNPTPTPMIPREVPTSRQPPPIPSAARPLGQSPRPEGPRSPTSPGKEPNASPMSPRSPTVSHAPAKRSSLVPPVPGASPVISSPQTRAPPPLPPHQPPLMPHSNDRERQDAMSVSQDEDSEEEVTEYEGDYDTDIASGATHKEALRPHEKLSSTEDAFASDEASYHHSGLPSLGPPPAPPPVPGSSVPSSSAPRAAPPPLPTQPPRYPPPSADMPRAAPPPPPPPTRDGAIEAGDDYDPFNYAAPRHGVQTTRTRESLPTASQPAEESYDDLYSSSPPRERKSSLPPASSTYPTSLPPTAAPPMPRQSLDVPRKSTSRRSVDAQRSSMDQGFIAEDIDLGRSSHWWMQRRMPPPVFQHRNDVNVEVEESQDREITIKTVYALFMDYSQTVVTARFDARDALKVEFGQSHDPPPPRLRQDQLEDAHSKFGARLAEMANGKVGSILGNGSSFALISDLFNSLPGALPPIGTRAFGAVVYTNLANASVQQLDEIRAGDIVSFRNAKLQGHRGRPIKQKYNIEVGKPDHVGIVVDWDGTKKKVRAWEQGRESKKVKIESFKLEDLRSGEVKVWRVVPREWVGWGGGPG